MAIPETGRWLQPAGATLGRSGRSRIREFGMGIFQKFARFGIMENTINNGNYKLYSRGVRLP
jgi:hypothetical protein